MDTANAADTEAATAHVVRIINDAWIGSMLAVGERTGLLERLAERPQWTVEELAAAGRHHPRYVREWLWVMVAAGFVEAEGDARTGTFALRPAYVPALTRAGGPQHWSRITRQISAFARLEDDVVADFALGRGLPVARYEALQEALEGESSAIFGRTLLDEVLPALGVAERLAAGGSVVDLGCGTGGAAVLLARAFPQSAVLGVDLSAAAIATARERAADLPNCEFVVADIEPLELAGEHDLIMAANTAHDLADPEQVFAAARERLRPGGVFYLHELSATVDMHENVRDPHAPGILAFSVYHCLPLSLGRGGHAPGGMWGRERWSDTLRAAGFGSVEILRAPSDPNNDTFVARP